MGSKTRASLLVSPGPTGEAGKTRSAMTWDARHHTPHGHDIQAQPVTQAVYSTQPAHLRSRRTRQITLSSTLNDLSHSHFGHSNPVGVRGKKGRERKGVRARQTYKKKPPRTTPHRARGRLPFAFNQPHRSRTCLGPRSGRTHHFRFSSSFPRAPDLGPEQWQPAMDIAIHKPFQLPLPSPLSFRPSHPLPDSASQHRGQTRADQAVRGPLDMLTRVLRSQLFPTHFRPCLGPANH